MGWVARTDAAAPPAEDRRTAKSWLKMAASLLLLGFLGGALLFNQSIKNKAKVGAPLPAWRGVTDLEGRDFPFADLLGKPFVLNIWTTWCISCKEESAVLEAFHRRYSDRMRMVGVNVREPLDAIQRYRADFGQTYLMLRDQHGNITGPYNVRGYPETWFADAGGVARAQWDGPLTFEQMQDYYHQTTGRAIDGEGVGPVREGDNLLAAVLGPRGGFVAAVGRGLFRADDPAGLDRPAAWRQVAGVGPAAGLAVAGERLLAAGGEGGLLVSDDGGVSWQAVEGAQLGPVLAVGAAGADAVAWTPDRGGLLWRSADGGRTWSQAAGSPPASQVRSLAVRPGKADHLLAAGDGRLFASRDGGRSWQTVPVEERNFMPQWPGKVDLSPAVLGVAFDPVEVDAVYLATEKGIWKSGKGGAGATWLRGSPMRLFASVQALRLDGGRVAVLAGAPNGDLYLSEDGGRSWRFLSQ